MIPPSNTNKPRQFLRPGLPSQGTPVPNDPVSPPPETAPQDVAWLQAPITGEYTSQAYEPGFPPSPAAPGNAFGRPPTNTGSQPVSPIRPLFSGQQHASQFRPMGTNKFATPAYPVTGKQQAPLYETGGQDATFFQPYGGSQFEQSEPPFQPFDLGSPQSLVGQPAENSFLSPTTGRQQTPPYSDGSASPPFNNFQGPAFSQSAPSMPAFPPVTGRQSAPSMPPFTGTGMQNAPVMPGFQTSGAWPAAGTAPRPITRSTPSTPSPRSVKPLKKFEPKKGLPFIAAALSLVLVVAVVLVSQRDLLFPPAKNSQTSAQSSTSQIVPTPAGPSLNSITNNKEISPFLFGTNMALFHDNDEPILNSAATRQQLKNIGVRIIRMPTRTTLRPETTIKAAQAIKDIGATALVVMHGPEFKEAPLYEADQQVISTITKVFGSQTVYFEFGNESDLNGIDVAHYVQKWNAVIPLLKKEFPTARFIGGDNYQFTRRYLKTFLSQANPLPDGISWHEYTCSVDWSAAFCLANIDTWAGHFAQARAAMHEAIGKELPIWVSEWNYTSNQAVVNGQPINDGKYNDPTFMQAWTTKAMKTLIDNRIFASMQYFATNLPMPLVSNDQIGIEGKIFQQNYKTYMVDGTVTPPVYYKGPPAPILNPNAQYSFETPGSSGWTAVGGGISQPMSTTAKALDGSRSLMFNLANNSEDDTPFISVNGSTMPSTPKGGQMISMYIYVSNPDALVNAKIFVADPSRAWHFANSDMLTPGAWNKIWYSLPVNYSKQVSQLGIQFFTSRPGVSTDVYIDGIEWK